MIQSPDSTAAPPDDAAAVRASRHEPERFAEVFHRCFPEIHRYIARRLGTDAADDLAAEVFMAAFRRRDRFDPERGAVRPWHPVGAGPSATNRMTPGCSTLMPTRWANSSQSGTVTDG